MFICQDVIQNPFTTQGEFQKDLHAIGTEVSKDTISWTLFCLGPFFSDSEEDHSSEAQVLSTLCLYSSLSFYSGTK